MGKKQDKETLTWSCLPIKITNSFMSMYDKTYGDVK